MPRYIKVSELRESGVAGGEGRQGRDRELFTGWLTGPLSALAPVWLTVAREQGPLDSALLHG